MPQNKRLLGIGIDLIAVSRAKDFLRRHRQTLFRRFLSPSESRRVGAPSKLTPLQFSKLFSAKEAYFKSLNESWMGLGGFRSIEVKPLPGNRFRVKSRLWPGATHTSAEGFFFHATGLVGAQVRLWSLK